MMIVVIVINPGISMMNIMEKRVMNQNMSSQMWNYTRPNRISRRLLIIVIHFYKEAINRGK